MGLMTLNAIAASEAASGRPKLVVGIVIDQLRSDYMEYLKGIFGEKGLKRLMESGLYARDVDFKSDLQDPAAATALLYTGTYPRINGIPGAEIYSAEKGVAYPALEDKESLGNFTREALSPAALRVSTIADEIAADGAGIPAIYSIAPDAQQAIVMAGHAGNCALWINDVDGQWSSTAYYRDFPQLVSRRNHSQPLRQRIDTIRWKPLLKTDRYPGVSNLKKDMGFRYNFPRADRDVFRRFKSSALVNSEVTDVAIAALSELPIGKSADVTDMLSVGYTAAPYLYASEGDTRLELFDTYIRLDAQIARLLEAVDKKVGLDNAVIFLASTGYYFDSDKNDPKLRIPAGSVSARRIESLLNAFLSATYGNGDYVKGIFGNHIYLDHKAIEAKSIDLESALRNARNFIVKMSGISDARTLSDILSDVSPEGICLRNSIDPKTAGDIIITFSPGWTVTEENINSKTPSDRRPTGILSPFILMAPGVKPLTISEPVDVERIAPTISSSIRIRAPNGAKARPLAL